jgi:hypothetical protein
MSIPSREVVLIGSGALAELGLKDHDTCRDIDVIATHEGYQSIIQQLKRGDVPISYGPLSGDKMIIKNHLSPDIPMEVEMAWPGTTGEEFLRLVQTDSRSKFDDVWVAPVEALYALKMSHRYLKDSPHFEKTRQDIMFLRRELDTREIDPHYAEWFKRREKATYNYGHPNLNQKSQSFFSGDGVAYVWDHDSIHEAMKIYAKPAYKYFQGPDEVKVDRERWEVLAHQVKIASVVEESYVLALERSQVPFDFKPDPVWSFKKALEKVCTSITSGWWREFAWEHYDEAVILFEDLQSKDSYVDLFHRSVRGGTIKPGKDHG